MCQPAPYGRCYSHASKALVKAEKDFQKALVEKRKLATDYSKANMSYERISGAFVRPTGGRPGYYLPSASKKAISLERDKRNSAKAKLDKSRIKSKDAYQNVLEKRMQQDSTQTGYKALVIDVNAENQQERLDIAGRNMLWQKTVKNIKTSDGHLLASPEGLKSPEAPAQLNNLLREAESQKQASEDYHKKFEGQAETSLKVFNDAKLKKSRIIKTEVDRTVLAEMDDDIRQKRRAYEIVRDNRNSAKFEILMYKSRIDELNGVIEKTK